MEHLLLLDFGPSTDTLRVHHTTRCTANHTLPFLKYGVDLSDCALARAWSDRSMSASSLDPCELAASGDVDALRRLPVEELTRLDAKGSAPIHWAASTGRLDALKFLVHEGGCDPESTGLTSTRSKKRRPLHWAARNGQLECVAYLVRDLGVDPDPRDKQSVSPLQLACWQNRFTVARYLVETAGVDVTQLNNFECGVQHWIGTVPRELAGEAGRALLPLASWLRDLELDFHAVQRQGHTPLHKAAWGGHLELCRWLRDECGAVDDIQDKGGNFAADVAEMAGHVHIAAWLRAECSGARARSCAALGLPPSTTDLSLIRAAYLELARKLHPDRSSSATEDFAAIRAAYVHLTEEGGRGSQSNPTHSLRKMLLATVGDGGGGRGGGDLGSADGDGGVEERCRCFKAQLAAVCHEYGGAGIPISSLKKKFAEVWRGETVPSAEALGLPPRTSLVKIIESFSDTVNVVHGRDGAPPRAVAIVSRDTALGHARAAQEPGTPAEARAADPTGAAKVDVVDDDGGAVTGGADNTRISTAKWPVKALETLPVPLRPLAGETLDLILSRKVLLLQARRGYRANSDSMLLPYFAHQQMQLDGRAAPSAVADLGAGNGLVGILSAAQWPAASVTLYERQPSLVDLCRRNIALNGLAPPPPPQEQEHGPGGWAGDAHPRARVCACDIADASTYEHGVYDCVVCNPPFYAMGNDGQPRKGSEQKNAAWVESTAGIERFVGAMADMLRPGGSGFFVYDASEEARLVAALAADSGRVQLVHVARMVHMEGDAPEQSGHRVFVHILRGTARGKGMRISHHQEELSARFSGPGVQILSLHPRRRAAAAAAAAACYTDGIETWIRSLPPSHYSIRTPGF